MFEFSSPVTKTKGTLYRKTARSAAKARGSAGGSAGSGAAALEAKPR